jgi:hypothetical protein
MTISIHSERQYSLLPLRSGRRWRVATDEGLYSAKFHGPSSALWAPPSRCAGMEIKLVSTNQWHYSANVSIHSFPCEAGEGGAQRRMRAYTQPNFMALPPPYGHLLPAAQEWRSNSYPLTNGITQRTSVFTPSPAKREKVARSDG